MSTDSEGSESDYKHLEKHRKRLKTSHHVHCNVAPAHRRCPEECTTCNKVREPEDVNDLGHMIEATDENDGYCAAADAKNAMGETPSSWEDEMVGFLASIGAESAWPTMRAEDIDLLSLPLLSEQDLLFLGIISTRTRRTIMQEAQALARQRRWRVKPADAPNTQIAALKTSAINAVLDAPERSGGADSVSTTFGRECKQQSVRKYIPDLPGSKELNRNLKRGEGNALLDPWKQVPAWHKVPGADFIVDTFKAEYKKTQCEHWFLTHFHTDHWQGLRKSFHHGTIHCTPETARLVHGRLGIEQSRIAEHPLYTRSVVGPQGVAVTAINANHCPGACMFIFEVPGQPPLLHTGDFRFDECMKEDEHLQALRKNAAVVLDTTYASEEHCFPKQENALLYAKNAARAEASTCNPLFLVGTYSLGKEKVVLAVADALQSKVYAAPSKLSRLEALGFDMSRFTQNESEARVQAVGMWQLSQKQLRQSLDRHKGTYDCIVAFNPTGWTFAGSGAPSKSKGKQKQAQQQQTEVIALNQGGKREQNGSIVMHNVPYSEHSSFDELVAFLRWFQPVSMVPSVAKSERHSQMLMKRLKAHAGIS